jgi:phosphatidylserine/phosphatidylglycerophosphate/cardiolipin synthase-like enzyme
MKWFRAISITCLFVALISTPSVAAPMIETAHTRIDWAFDGHTQQQLVLDTIDQASHTLDIAIFTLTDPEIIYAIRNAQRRGLRVRLISDQSQLMFRSQQYGLKFLQREGIPVKINTHPGLMHLKLIISDQSYVLTGSYNFTKTAKKQNDEIIMRVYARTFVNSCINEFGQMWNDSQRFNTLQ